MTLITIPLNTGHNYIAFPATSTDNFGTLLVGIRDKIESFYKHDPRLSLDWVMVDDFEFIEQGRGYFISLTSPGDIIYDGIEYTITFDQLKSRLLRGWNLIGTGSNILYIPGWCRIIDIMTGFPTTRLEPNKSYWVDYYDCMVPTAEPYLLISLIGLGIAITSLLISLRSVRA